MTREEAIKVASEMYGWLKTDREREALETLVPELAESEDEKVLDYLIEFIYRSDEDIFPKKGGVSKLDILTYLEKQKEENHDGKKWIYEDEYHKDLERCFNDGKDEVLENPEKYGLQREQKPVISDEAIREGIVHFGITQHQIDNWLKKYINIVEQKPAEWSEEDEKMLKWLCRIVHSQRVNKVITLKEESELGKWMDKWLNHNPCLQGQKDNKCISPKEGDIVVNKYGEISVFESWGHHPDGGSFNDKTYFFAKCTLEGDYYYDYDCHPDSEGLRYATPEEIRKIVPYILKSVNPEEKTDWTKKDDVMIQALYNCIDELHEVYSWNYVYTKGGNIHIGDLKGWVERIERRIKKDK